MCNAYGMCMLAVLVFLNPSNEIAPKMTSEKIRNAYQSGYIAEKSEERMCMEKRESSMHIEKMDSFKFKTNGRKITPPSSVHTQ